MWFRLAGIALVVWGLALAGWGAAHLREPPMPPSYKNTYSTSGQMEDIGIGFVAAMLGVIVYRRKAEWWWR